MSHGAVAHGSDENERSSLQGPAHGPAEEVERGVLQPAQAVAQSAARVVYVGQPGGGDGGRVDVGGRVGPRDERGAGQGRDPEDGVGGRVQSGRSLASALRKDEPCATHAVSVQQSALSFLLCRVPAYSGLTARTMA